MARSTLPPQLKLPMKANDRNPVEVTANENGAVALSGVVIEINRLHAEICQAARTTIDKAIRIGELLAEQKEALKHGEWLPWLKANVEFSRQTADNYRRVYEKREDIKLLSVGNLTDAYRLLASGTDEPDTQARDYDFDAVWEQMEFRLWKLERAWKEVELKEDLTRQDKRQLVDVMHEGQALGAAAREFALRSEIKLGQTLKELDDKRKNLESVIGLGYATACQCAAAITEIRDNHLYRNTHSSFAEYCHAKLGATDSRVNELLSAFAYPVFAETGGEL
jgi:Protein of unknown function (DUF3102)